MRCSTQCANRPSATISGSAGSSWSLPVAGVARPLAIPITDGTGGYRREKLALREMPGDKSTASEDRSSGTRNLEVGQKLGSGIKRPGSLTRYEGCAGRGLSRTECDRALSKSERHCDLASETLTISLSLRAYTHRLAKAG